MRLAATMGFYDPVALFCSGLRFLFSSSKCMVESLIETQTPKGKIRNFIKQGFHFD